MAGRLGLFGRSRFKIFPDRTKFDPDLHPEHAPYVPEEHGDEYLKLVRRRTQNLGSGHSSATAQLHKRDGKAWVSFATAHAGIAFEWGSYAQYRKLILSSSAAKFNKKAKSPQAKKDQAVRTNRLKDDALARLRRGVREDMKLELRGPHAGDRAVVDTIRRRIKTALLDASSTQPVTRTLPYHVLEKIKRPFRATEEEQATPPGVKLLARLRNIESLRDLERLVGKIQKDD